MNPKGDAADCMNGCTSMPAAEPFPELPVTKPINRGQARKGVPGPALKHGAYSKLIAAGDLAGQVAIAAELRKSAATIIEQRGIDAEIGFGLVRRHCRLELVEDHLWTHLLSRGLTTGKGRTRAATALWLQVVDRLHRSALAIGLERKPKAVGLLEYFQQADEDAEPARGGAE